MNRIISVLLFTIVIVAAMVNAEEVSLHLNPGNNLVSVPLTTTPAMTLETLRALCQSAFVAFQDSNGKTCFYQQGMPNLSVDPAKAYLVNCQNASGLTVLLTGARPSTTTVALRRGITWIGFAQGVPLGATAQDILREQGLTLLMDTGPNSQFRSELPHSLEEGGGDGVFLENGKGALLVSSVAKTITLTPGMFLSRGTAIAFTKALTSPADGSQIFMIEEQIGSWTEPSVIGPLDIYDKQPSFSRTDRNLLALASPYDCWNEGIFLFNLSDNTFRRLTGMANNGACQPVKDLFPSWETKTLNRVLLGGKSTFPGSMQDIGYTATDKLRNPLAIFVTDSINETAPVFSPSGQTIYFLSDRDGQKQKKIWAVPASILTSPSTTEYRLSKTWMASTLVISEDRLAVGPDGVLYCGSQGRIYSVDPHLPADTNATALTAGPSDAYAGVSPDGSRLAFVRSSRELWICNWRGANQSLVYTSDTAISDTTWRP